MMKTQTRVYEGLIMARKKESTENNNDKTKKANKVKKNNSADTMLHYTARDYGQEYIMKRKMIRAIFIAIMLAIALIVFIALYMDQSGRVQETYRTKYTKSLETVVFDLDDYKNAEADYDLRYRMILADMSNANAFAFLLDDFEEDKARGRFNPMVAMGAKEQEQVVTALKPSLEYYLNEIYLGRGCWGVKSAAAEYFTNA